MLRGGEGDRLEEDDEYLERLLGDLIFLGLDDRLLLAYLLLGGDRVRLKDRSGRYLFAARGGGEGELRRLRRGGLGDRDDEREDNDRDLGLVEGRALSSFLGPDRPGGT